jgi:hypothetical protein
MIIARKNGVCPRYPCARYLCVKKERLAIV